MRSFAPSLSAGVQDALFSYWRLPLATRRALADALPTIEVGAASARVDWEQLASCLRGARAGANPAETAWAFALHAEAAVTAVTNPRTAGGLPVTHGEQVDALLALLHDERGEFYMAFLVLVTVLEKALYDLHHHQQQQQRRSSEPAMTKRKNLILRDLLHSAPLARALPDGLLRLLRVLFLPSGLNLRNLVWHGFVVPAECPKCFGCLVAVLLLALPRAPATAGDQLFDLRSYDDRFVVRDDALTALVRPSAPLAGSGDGGLADLVAAASSSGFVPNGRRQLVRRAFEALVERGDELWFLFALLPVLEHAVRVQFVAANRERWGLSSAYGTAQLDAYYSTLDGFGQRDKHQVLLHALVVVADDDDDGSATAAPCSNQLYAALPAAALAVCLDLFMMASGPNLRAKLCHGEANLSTLLRGPSTASSPSSVSVATQLLVLAWLSLCRSADTATGTDTSTDTDTSTTTALSAVVGVFEKSYRSSFHPFHQLQRALASALDAATQLSALRERYARLEVAAIDGGSEASVWIAFPSAGDAIAGGRSAFGVAEKASRLDAFRELLLERDGLFTCAWILETQHTAPAKGSFPELLVRLGASLREVLRKLRRHYETQHDGRLVARRSAFLGLLDADSSSLQLLADDAAVESHLLALSDDDGLSVAACMLEVAASTQRACRSFQARHLELQQLIASGRARTNHRRSFLHSVFFLPLFARVQVVCLSLVEHQLLHLRSRAVWAAAGGDATAAAGQLCSHARSFELLQRKLLLFATAFEGCTSSDASAQKSAEKALLLALQFLDSKALRAALAP